MGHTCPECLFLPRHLTEKYLRNTWEKACRVQWTYCRIQKPSTYTRTRPFDVLDHSPGHLIPNACFTETPNWETPERKPCRVQWTYCRIQKPSTYTRTRPFNVLDHSLTLDERTSSEYTYHDTSSNTIIVNRPRWEHRIGVLLEQDVNIAEIFLNERDRLKLE